VGDSNVIAATFGMQLDVSLGLSRASSCEEASKVRRPCSPSFLEC
jgi:hypothetical protein